MKKILLTLIAGISVILLTNAQGYKQVTKGLPLLSSSDQHYGFSVDIDGNYAVVGAYKSETGKGSVYVLFYNGTSWVTQAELTSSDRAVDDDFGYSVSISGDNVVVGAHRDDDNSTSSGSAYVFTKPTLGWANSTETAKLTASDASAGEFFGRSVSISGDDIVVGAYRDGGNGPESGAAYVFTKSGLNWVTTNAETAKLTASDGQNFDEFGVSVSISGQNIVVGAHQEDDGGINSGAAYVFTRPGSAWVTTTTETKKLTASDPATNNSFGKSVSISGNNIVVGAFKNDNKGSAYVFTNTTGWQTTETAKLTSSDRATSDNFGYSVSIDADKIVVGAYFDDDNAKNSGSAYTFDKPTAAWVDTTETSKITASDGADADLFGLSVAMSGDKIIIGSYLDDDKGNESGSAYFYEPCSAMSSTLDTTVCFGGSIVVNGTTYNSTNLTGSEKFNVGGCDSIVTVNLTIMAELKSTVNKTVCFGESITVNGTIYDANNLTGTAKIAANGCDSTVTVNLTIGAPALISNKDIDINGTFTLPSGTVISEAGTYIDTLKNTLGCDSSITTFNATKVTGINTIDNLKLKIHPNPSNGIVNINANTLANYSVRVYNQLGEVVLEQGNNVNTTQIKLNSGVYFVEITTQKDILTQKLIVQ